MKTKTLKIFGTILMLMVVVMTSTQVALATDDPSGILGKIDPDMDGALTSSEGLIGIANQVIGLIQIASAVAAVILIAVFGFKFILGSANEKADYQKSFIPLIVGVVVVFSATSIAKLLFGLIG